MMNLEDTIKKAVEGAKEMNRQIGEAQKIEDRETRHSEIDRIFNTGMDEAQLGRITVKAVMAGNTRANHVRVTFKVDGKRASRKQAESAL